MVLVFDVGGMSTKIALIDSKTDQFIIKDQIIYSNFINGQSLLFEIKKKINQFKNNNLKAICISSCGIINSISGEISGSSAIKDYYLINYKKDLKEFNIPVFIENDANCAAICESEMGVVKNNKNAVFLVIGTGIGGAIIINKMLYKGSNLFAGEFGCSLVKIQNNQHINVSESYSAKAIETNYFTLTNKKLTAKEIFNKYKEDNIAKKVINKTINGLCKLMINITAIIDPEVFVIGGAISQNQLFINLLNKKFKKYMIISNINLNIKIKPAMFFNDANIYGAYLLYKKDLYV
ncbi:ROK family protein [Mycoplasma leachii]|uniref:Sugar kinase, ROK family n=1 Tax=Mycoplasma leachii 06049 TaxID=1188244 RepID=A0A2T4I9M3_9MOLU|nr:ROK family protein [Mycoplasma leachii]PTD31245.1 Sugar kinase, ROK family [Mycoplasma leachii 06049]